MNTQFNEAKLAELILFIAKRSESDRRFGKTKLLKLLAYSDFEAYSRLGMPITGAHYRKLPHGPAPREAPELLEILEEREELQRTKALFFGFEQQRYRALREPNEALFSSKELDVVSSVISRFSGLGGREIADQSHRDFIGWRMADDLADIPYRTALISNEEPSPELLAEGRRRLSQLRTTP
jgi:hypothetical protein